MAKCNLHQFVNDPQYLVLTDENNMIKGLSFNQFVNELIRENATYKYGSFYLSANDLSDVEKRHFLSYIADDINEIYEYSLDALMSEYGKIMQEEIDKRTGDIFSQAMEEQGMRRCQHQDNGESRWIKR